MTLRLAVRRRRKTADVRLMLVLPSLPTPTAVPVYCWCDWCNKEWEALGARIDRHRNAVWNTGDHNQRCEEGGRYVGFAWTPRERAKRRGELFPGES
jgi:hypothetical protein